MPTADQATQRREIDLLHGLVATPSLSGQEGPAVAYLRDAMAALGFDARVDDAGNAVGVLGAGPREIVLLGHIDTVPGDIAVRVADGVLYGRGAVDAKGPLATFVCAAARARPANLRVVVIGAVGEEAESDGAWYVVSRYRPDYCVIGEPGGWDSIVLGYKGSLSVTYRLERPGGHSAGPHATTAQAAVDFWNQVCAYTAAFNQDRPRGFDTLDPTLRAIASSSDGLRDRVEIRAGFRLPLDLDGAAVLGKLQGLTAASGDGATLIANQPLPAFRSDKHNALVRAFLGAVREVGGKPRFKVKTGTADMNIVGPTWGCPIVAYGPGDSTLDHTPHERLDLAEYQRAIATLADVLRQLT